MNVHCVDKKYKRFSVNNEIGPCSLIFLGASAFFLKLERSRPIHLNFMEKGDEHIVQKSKVFGFGAILR